MPGVSESSQSRVGLAGMVGVRNLSAESGPCPCLARIRCSCCQWPEVGHFRRSFDSWLMNLSLRLRGGVRTRPSTTPLPGRARPRRTSILPHCPPPVRSRTPWLWRRNATFGIAGSSSAWSFSAPRDACGAQGRTCHGFRQRTVGSPCNHANNIRDNIRYKRVDPRPITSITHYRP